MLARSDTDGNEMIAGTLIRRPCNSKPGRVISLSVTLAAAIAMLAMLAERTHAQKVGALANSDPISANAQQMIVD